MAYKTNNLIETSKKITAPIPEAAGYYGIGIHSMRKLAEEANAIVSIGSRKVVIMQKVNDYIMSK